MRNVFVMIKKLFFLGLFVATTISYSPISLAASDVRGWYREIAQKVAQNQSYPRSALRRGIEGVAKVKVYIQRDGVISQYELVQSTGHSVLDSEVNELMSKISPLPTPPADATDEDLTVTLPLSWVLQ